MLSILNAFAFGLDICFSRVGIYQKHLNSESCDKWKFFRANGEFFLGVFGV